MRGVNIEASEDVLHDVLWFHPYIHGWIYQNKNQSTNVLSVFGALSIYGNFATSLNTLLIAKLQAYQPTRERIWRGKTDFASTFWLWLSFSGVVFQRAHAM